MPFGDRAPLPGWRSIGVEPTNRHRDRFWAALWPPVTRPTRRIVDKFCPHPEYSSTFNHTGLDHPTTFGYIM